MTTIRRYQLIVLAVAALLIGALLGSQITHAERAHREKWEFPCPEEDEAKVTYVTEHGNVSICEPLDNLHVHPS